MVDVEIMLIDSAAKAVTEELPNFKEIVNSNFNLFEAVDSFSVVNILLETETSLEALLGRYIPLADENIFDALKSPFLKWSEWVKYVTDIIKSEG